MEAIKTYLETMFGALPQTEKCRRLKNELLISMEEKYNELKAAGKSENEAIGTVISEFGDIEELAEEIGRPQVVTGEALPVIELALAQEFLREGKKTAFRTAVGVFIIIIGVALLITSLALGEFRNGSLNNSLMYKYLAVGLSALIIFVAVGVGILAPAWIRFSKYEFLNIKNEFILPEHVKQYVNNYKNDFSNKKISLIVIGVIICILSTLTIIFPALFAPQYVLMGVSVFLGTVAVGVFPLVIMGVNEAVIATLLRPEWFVKEFREHPQVEKIVGTVAACFWPLITALYLLFSFMWDSWHISWIIWPVAGLIFGAFSGAVGAYYHTGTGKR